jgi:hypothetical protein
MFCQASSLHLLLAQVAELSGRTQLLHQSKFGIPLAKVDLRVQKVRVIIEEKKKILSFSSI